MSCLIRLEVVALANTLGDLSLYRLAGFGKPSPLSLGEVLWVGELQHLLQPIKPVQLQRDPRHPLPP